MKKRVIGIFIMIAAFAGGLAILQGCGSSSNSDSSSTATANVNFYGANQ